MYGLLSYFKAFYSLNHIKLKGDVQSWDHSVCSTLFTINWSALVLPIQVELPSCGGLIRPSAQKLKVKLQSWNLSVSTMAYVLVVQVKTELQEFQGDKQICCSLLRRLQEQNIYSLTP